MGMTDSSSAGEGCRRPRPSSVRISVGGNDPAYPLRRLRGQAIFPIPRLARERHARVMTDPAGLVPSGARDHHGGSDEANRRVSG